MRSVLIAVCLVALLPGSVWAEDTAGSTPADPPGESRAGYWGPIDPPHERNTAAPEDHKRAAWEHVVNAPYHVAVFPFRMVAGGLEVTTEWLDETRLVRRILSLFPLKLGPTFFTPSVSFSSSDGFAGGGTLFTPGFLGENNRMRISGIFSTEGDQRATFGVDWIHSENTATQVGIGYRSKVNTRFYGLGAESPEDRESFFHQETAWGGVTIERRLGAGISGTVGALYSQVHALDSDCSDHPHLVDEFSAELAAGAVPSYASRSDGWSFSAELRHDDTEETGRPEGGGIRRAKVEWFQARGNSHAEFVTYRGELQQFLPLWHTNRALAVRAVYTSIDNVGDDPVPFQRLPTNDDPDLFRGYQDFRFRDEGLVAASIEYRWPLWSLNQKNGIGADAYLFVDWGQVFSDLEEISTDRVTTSYGGGLRAAGFGRYFGRIELAWSEEDFQVRFRGDQIFQWVSGGLYGGRNPVPAR